jgi:uncharacterized Zn finger protein (UPF0148 family)
MENTIQIPSLTEDIVYCPLCGAINSFKKSKIDRTLIYFCTRCDKRLNDLWDGLFNGSIEAVKCSYCHETTFEGEVYCIACGAKQQKVRKGRADKLSQAKVRDHDLDTTRDGTDKFNETMRAYVRKYF